MANMKKYIAFLFISWFSLAVVVAQETEEVNTPVPAPFENGTLIDQQTTFIPDAKSLEFVIHHKFGTMDKGISDLYGIYSPGANVRLGLSYVPVKNLQIGVGTTKTNMYTDLNAKWTILQQTENNKVPVAVALYGYAAIDGRGSDEFGTGMVVDTKGPAEEAEFGFSDRLSYFSQLIISRRVDERLSLQAGASFTHYNMVGWDEDHDIIGLHANGRFKFSSQSSFIFNYDYPLKIQGISEQIGWDHFAKQNLSFGFEISTFTHAFQMYVGNANGILPHHNMKINVNEPFEGMAIGFTITRLWMY